MKRIMSIIKKDYALALRDSIALYIIIGPLLLAVAVRLFLPTVEDVKLNFIVDKSIQSEYIAQLESYGTVESLDSANQVYERVNKTDAAAGLVMENDQIKVIFEGNEPREIIQSYTAVFEKVLNQNDEYSTKLSVLSDKKPMLYGLMSTIIVMTALFLGGTVSGFNIVTEKDTKAIRAMAVAPLKMSTYLFSRGIVAVVTSVVIGILSAFILAGTSIDYTKLVAALLASSPLIVIITLLIGRMADNQINSIAAIKLIMPVYLTLPLASLFIPAQFQFVLYPLPNFWAFQSFQHLFLSEGSTSNFYLGISILFVLGAIALLALSRLFRTHFGLR